MIEALPAKKSWWWPVVLVGMGMALLPPLTARGGQPTAIESVAIPPDREELFAAMLGRGAVLPDACTFATGQIERAVVRGAYTCPGGEVVLELRNTSDAPADAIRTEKIAIVIVRGGPPAALLAALEKRIREREGAFEWLRLKIRSTRKLGCGERAPLPSVMEPYFPACYPLFAAVLVGLAQTMVMVLGLGCGLLQLYRTPKVPTAE